MPTTPYLGITEVAANQSGKEVTINNAILALEAAENATLAVSFAAGNVTLSVNQFTRNFLFNATGATADRVLNIPATVNAQPTSRIFAVRNSSGHNITIQITGGAGDNVVSPDGVTQLLTADGDGNIYFVAAPPEAVAFLGLSDTPDAYTGQEGKVVGVKSDASGLEFVDAGASEMGELTDVDVTTPPSDGDVLIWDSVTGKWIPGAMTGGGGGGGGPWWFDPPLAADFTALSGDATTPTFVDDSDVGFILRLGAPVTGKKARLALTTIPSPTANWSVEFRCDALVPSGEQCLHGLVLRNSTNGKMYVAGRIGHAFDYLVVQRLTALSGGTITDLFADNYVHVEDAKFIKVVYTASTTTYDFYFSVNGKEWMLVASGSITDNFGTGNQADQIGFGVIYDYALAGGTQAQFNCNRFVTSW